MTTDHLLPLRLRDRRNLAEGVVELVLEPAGDDVELPRWQPGAHIDLVLPGGIERQYSLCGPLEAPTWRVAVLRERAGRGGSDFVHDALEVGQALWARIPRNHFGFDPSRPASFLAGGIGITPLLSMIEAAEAAGQAWTLAYAGRSRAAMAYLAELEERYPGRVSAHPTGERRLDVPGVLASAREEGRVVYCCGPARLIEAAMTVAATMSGVELRTERFVPKVVEAHEEVAFEIEAGGQVLTVPPDRSILEVCEDAGMLVLSSCREGTCGTCETPLLEGEADHRDSVLTPEEQAENRTMMICVSRARSPRLVLDL